MPRFFAVLFGLTVLLSMATASAHERPAPGEAMLEGKLVAPCCWTQTLDMHESPLATELRDEIHARLGKGESADAIEDDLASRYGERIRAVPKGHDPRAAVSIGTGVAMLLSALGLLWLVRRWTRTPSRRAAFVPGSAPQDMYDDRLDDELRRLDHP